MSGMFFETVYSSTNNISAKGAPKVLRHRSVAHSLSGFVRVVMMFTSCRSLQCVFGYFCQCVSERGV